MTLAINDLKRGLRIILDGDPYIVMYVKHLHMGRGGALVQTRLRNLRTGRVFEKNFKPGEGIEEANLQKMGARFAYEKRGEYWFHELGKPANRFELDKEILGEQVQFLKPQMEVAALMLKGEIINVELPIKADYEVIEAPPNIKGNTAQGGNKQVVIETGVKVTTPMFIESGDKIRINTQTGEYVERA